MEKNVYIMDTDALITPSARNYPPDVFPGYWGWLQDQIPTGVVTSIKAVENELVRCTPSLEEWVQNEGSAIFAVLPTEVHDHHIKVIEHIKALRKYKEKEVNKFSIAADSWLIAFALHLREGKQPVVPHVVTCEAKNPLGAKIKIPDVCERLEIGCITPAEMLRQEGALFVQGKRGAA